MSASNEWTEWHLTPRGWEEGDSKTDFAKNSKPTPKDRVQTVEHREFLSSSFSRLEVTNDIIWSSDDESLIAELRAKFGDAPNHL
ncbi:hypothetical protein JOH52_002827 [Sinorhizobium meliloti]|uniref:hypothetical protein n=1 Tax=Rhizobium meliloti TaxID=382 RepID=UPI000FDCAF99|nr:hypothetical protein [Sinorhizobium meliloti]MBP2466806.1 hypothetical protein [Sinorhizobium meliloti]MDE3765752.1 hypothetical protein [Sinorhizobium meliloti]MDE3781624.1 hypothetical protein [Sinorhizobium meliloti]MDE3783784.1 hypothetical protein [Sinorhizobium meliloti]MDE3803614.1 hypothetical protein [Sinorhizobium meliloti]